MQGLLRLMLVLSIFNTGCACKKKEVSQQEKINACMFDPTGNCPRMAAAMAMQYGQGMPPGVLPYYNVAPNGNPAILTGAGANGLVRVSGISDRDIKTAALKVQSAIQADAQNPNSLHYDPPSTVPQRNPADVAVVATGMSQNDQVGLNNGFRGSSGDPGNGGIR